MEYGMSSLLRKLVRDSGLDNPDFPIEDWDDVPLSRFAELIVKQCITQIETMLYSPDENPPEDEWLRGYDAGAQRAIEILKLDFGVVE
jgi:hypothetical protein